jgi:TetR/AcrR family transcriptional repressor of nem operon
LGEPAHSGWCAPRRRQGRVRDPDRAPRGRAGPPLRRLRKYFESLNQAAVRAEFSTGCLLGNFAAELSDQSSLIRERVDDAFAAWRDEVARVIGEAQKAGAISRDFSPQALAAFVIHAWEGAMLRAKVNKDRAPLDLFLKVTFAKLLV